MNEPRIGDLSAEDPDLNIFDTEPGSWFFSTPGLTQRLDLLVHLIEYSQQVVLVVAEEGMGKTTLSRELVTNQQQSWDICHLNGSNYDNGLDLIRDLADYWQLTADSIEQSEIELRQFFLSREGHAGLPVLILDDAHHLATETLNTLLELSTESSQMKGRLHAVIFSEPGIVPKLGSRAGVIHSLDLTAFGVAETAEYLRRCWQYLNRSEDFPFTADELRHVHEVSQGIPEEINRLAFVFWQKHHFNIDSEDDGFEGAYTEPLLGDDQVELSMDDDLEPLDDDDIEDWQAQPQQQYGFVIIAAVMITVIITVVWLLPEDETGVAKDLTELPLVIPQEMKEVVVLETPVSGLSEINEAATPLISENRVEAETVTTVVQQEAAPTETIAEKIEQVKPIPEEVKTVIPEPVVEKVKDEPLKEIVKPTPKVEKPKPKPKASGAYKDGTWLQTLPATHYVLQLFATYDKESAIQFIKRYNDQSKFAWYRTWRDGRSLYVVVYGNYKNKSTALKAVKSLPSSLKKLKPWGRSAEAIKIAILKG